MRIIITIGIVLLLCTFVLSQNDEDGTDNETDGDNSGVVDGEGVGDGEGEGEGDGNDGGDETVDNGSTDETGGAEDKTEPTLITTVPTPIQNVCETKQEWGFVCIDCKRMGTCMFINDQWRTIEIGKCDSNANLYCNDNSRNCSSMRACGITKPTSFTCNSFGIFPDPFDCTKFHVCSASQQSSGEIGMMTLSCNNDRAFSPSTNECTAHRSDVICKSPQFRCKDVGDMGAWPGNSNIFYVCIGQDNSNSDEYNLEPALFRCPAGQYFLRDRCLDSNSSSANTNSNNSNGETIEPNSIECTKEGLRKHPTDCTTYYYCDVRMKAIEYKCPPKSHFDDRQKSCIIGLCNSTFHLNILKKHT